MATATVAAPTPVAGSRLARRPQPRAPAAARALPLSGEHPTPPQLLLLLPPTPLPPVAPTSSRGKTASASGARPGLLPRAVAALATLQARGTRARRLRSSPRAPTARARPRARRSSRRRRSEVFFFLQREKKREGQKNPTEKKTTKLNKRKEQN